MLYVQGMLFMRQHNWDAAQSVLQKSDQLDPNQARVLAALGMTFCNQKNYGQAIPLLEKSRQLEPASGWETDFALAKAYYYHEQYEEALKMAESARANSHTSNSQVELLLAQCLTAVGRYGDSAEVLREFLKTHSNDPDAATAKRGWTAWWRTAKFIPMMPEQSKAFQRKKLLRTWTSTFSSRKRVTREMRPSPACVFRAVRREYYRLPCLTSALLSLGRRVEHGPSDLLALWP